MLKKTVALGFVGAVLDAGSSSARWERWRPTLCLCQQPDLMVDRLELLYDPAQAGLFARLREDVQQVSPGTEVRGHEMRLHDPWDFEEVYAALHDFTAGYSFEPESEDYLVHITTGTHVAQICLFLLTETRHFPARLLQTAPPRGRLRPERDGTGASAPGSVAIIDLDLSKYDRLAARFQREQADAVSLLKSGIPTRNKGFNRMIDQIERVASASTAPILLMGPTGAGKSFLARRIYELKKTKRQLSGAFVEVNCATLRGEGAMSALFGHVRGAFTGAVADRPGLLRAAMAGQLFLDEIGELGLDEQAMLLRAIEDKRFFPVGSDREIQGEFQLIAGTNRDLQIEVRQGRFREDLFARLNVWTFRLPGLAERREDIEPNLRYELERISRDGRRITINKEALNKFVGFANSPAASWRGNFRDLAAAVTRMSTLADGGRIDCAQVDEEVNRLRALWSVGDEADVLQSLLGERAADLDLFDRLQLRAVISVCREAKSLSDAGRQLFAVTRQAKVQVNDADRLRKYLARFGLDWAALVAG